MQSKATSVDVYLREVIAPRQEALTKLRNLCLKHLVGFEEVMEYGLPAYRRNGTVEVAFASQKNYISLYILKTKALEVHRVEFGNLSAGKGCTRFTSPEKLDFSN